MCKHETMMCNNVNINLDTKDLLFVVAFFSCKCDGSLFFVVVMIIVIVLLGFQLHQNGLMACHRPDAGHAIASPKQAPPLSRD